MDNLSHSVVGLVAGELIHRSLPAEADSAGQRKRRHLLLLSCWLASNFPDLDLVFSRLLPSPLGYLLHHRGHTHTLLYILPQALLVAGALWLLWPAARRLLQTSAYARTGFFASLLIGFVLHIAMDYLNNYGVHPFYPLDARWFYGDMVFIVEPVFWIAFGIPLAMTIRRSALRWLIIAALLAVPAYFTPRGFLLWGSLAGLILLALLTGWLQHRAGEKSRAALALAVVLGAAFVGVQALASHMAKNLVVANLETEPGRQIRDVSLTAYPANPFCWSFVALESSEAANTYTLHRGQLSLLPKQLPVNACPAAFSELDEESMVDPAIAFSEEESGDLSWFRTLQIANCHFDAWLRFARMPLLAGSSASDWRFGTNRNFTTIELREFDSSNCATGIPGWDYPRRDLLEPSSPAN